MAETWNVQQVADAAELSPETIRYYQKAGNQARKAGTETARDLPAPVGVEGGANVWDADEIRSWISTRKTPARRGAIPKSEMRAVLQAAEAGQIDRVITIARRNLA